MLKALEIENFKAFGQRTHIDFAPITLIFGENSAGKSSILHALNLLKQTRQSRERGALLLPRSEVGFVDLGSFQDLLFDHDIQRELVIRLDLEPETSPRWRSRSPRSDRGLNRDTLAFEIRFARPSEEDEVQLRTIELYSSPWPEPVARFQPTDLPKEELREIMRDSPMMIRTRHPLRASEVRAAKCSWITENPDFWRRYYDRTKRRAGEYVQELQVYRNRLMHAGSQKTLFGEIEEEPSVFLKAIEETVEFYGSDYSLADYIARMRPFEMGALVALDGFAPFPLRYRGRTLPEVELFRRVGPMRLGPRELTMDVGGYAFDSGRAVDNFLEMLYPMGPYRRPPERWYVFAGTSPQDVGYKGELLPDLLFRKPHIVAEANRWLERLEIGYQLRLQRVGQRIRDLFEVRLIDTRRARDVDVALSDVGFGISQILPFIVQSLAAEGRVISIEQPEVHIHPRLQADLGDLLAEAIKPPRSHRFIIETHSEHLVLRVQKLVRNGLLQRDDVSIIHVSRGPEGAKAQRLQLDDQGDFVDDWPGGFFPERLRELA